MTVTVDSQRVNFRWMTSSTDGQASYNLRQVASSASILFYFGNYVLQAHPQ